MKHLACIAFLAAAVGAARAEPAIVYDMGGKFDKSFNEAAWRGMERWKKETGKNYLEFEIANESQREQAMRRMAERGASPIIGVGFSQASSIEKVAKDFPKLQFAIVDMVVNQPNVQSVVFKEQEGSFLVGTMAAMASLPLSLAAWYTPMPVPPAAAKTTSAPLANCALASSPPRPGSLQAAPVVPVMLA